MKTVISELAPASTALAASICKKITGRLTSAVSKVSVLYLVVVYDIWNMLVLQIGESIVRLTKEAWNLVVR